MATSSEDDAGQPGHRHRRPAPLSNWYSPVRLLLLFCAMNLLVYVDRGVISSNGVNGARAEEGRPGYGIMGDFGLSLFEDGVLPAAFLVGLLVSSPLFAEAAKRYNALRLIAVGLAVWTLATFGCGLAQGFWTLTLCRMAVGVGEASFVALAAPFIDDAAPKAAKTRWLATFYLCIPVGYALGYIAGGALAGPLGWRGPFLLEAAAMSPFAAFCAFAPAIDIRGTHAGTESGDVGGGVGSALCGVGRDLRTLWRHRVYVLTVAGNAVYTGVIGAYAFMGPKAGRDVFALPPARADYVFGGVTVATGVVGTLAGGLALDRMGSSMSNALALAAVATAAGGACVVASFAAARSLAAFVPAFAAGELLLFAIQAPTSAVTLWAVPPGLRPFSMSLNIIVIHVLGDVPSPPALGWLQERLANWRLSMSLCTAWLALGVALFAAASVLARTAPDYRQQPPRSPPDLAPADVAAGEGPQAPLLSDGALPVVEA